MCIPMTPFSIRSLITSPNTLLTNYTKLAALATSQHMLIMRTATRDLKCGTKRLWDPKERFSFYQPVPLYWASPSDSLGNEDL
jgi:hypothetical protein